MFHVVIFSHVVFLHLVLSCLLHLLVFLHFVFLHFVFLHLVLLRLVLLHVVGGLCDSRERHRQNTHGHHSVEHLLHVCSPVPLLKFTNPPRVTLTFSRPPLPFKSQTSPPRLSKQLASSLTRSRLHSQASVCLLRR